MRNALFILALALVGTAAASDRAIQVEIQSPSAGHTVEDGVTNVEVEGIASAIGGVRYLDIMFVMDTSQSLRRSDPSDYRSAGAIGLVRNLSPKSDIKIGVISFDSKSDVAQSMTSDRDAAIETLRLLPRSGSTNIAAGITAALAELERNGRPGSSRVIMLFTDGMSNKNKAYDAAIEATKNGITIQTLMLGKDQKGSKIMDTIAWATGGSFLRVSDPSKLPEAFLNLRTTGVDSVTLSVNGSEPVPARLAGGTFVGSVPVDIGENRIVAFATSLDGDTQESEILVNVRDTSCAALEVMALNEGRPALSLNDRAVEIVVDASKSMWGQIDGRSKMEIAKTTLEEVSYWLPEDLDLALRAYGNTSSSDDNNCADSSLLVPFGERNREYVRHAIAGLRPTGQTPIAYALNQAAGDFGSLQSDRTLVLVSDGIESCGGDPVTAAYALRQQGIVVHLIGFGLGNATDEDAASLQAVANASGGRYVTAGSAEELKAALAETVATSFSVYQGSTEVASGSLGSAGVMLLPEGDYRVQLHSSPPVEAQVRLAPRDSVTLTLEKSGGVVSPFEQRDELPHTTCEGFIQPESMLGASTAR
ncbi:MAG: VWA domain-containing protein [Gammaproteobacteria bacterium]|nr:VWA domain-containing protein [Gammaproteobacteria bacterium]MDH3416194.1 VWA domain-containing protein [Gammaproteobacteria bacterium]